MLYLQKIKLQNYQTTKLRGYCVLRAKNSQTVLLNWFEPSAFMSSTLLRYIFRHICDGTLIWCQKIGYLPLFSTQAVEILLGQQYL